MAFYLHRSQNIQQKRYSRDNPAGKHYQTKRQLWITCDSEQIKEAL